MKSNFLIKIIFLTFLLYLIFTFKSPAFAAMDFTYNEINYSLPDLPADSDKFNSAYYSIFKISDTKYTMLSFTGYDPARMKVINTNESAGYVAVLNLEGNVVPEARAWFWSSENGGAWTLDSWQPQRPWYQYYGGAEMSDKFIRSSFPIYLATGTGSGPYTLSDDIFFPQTTLLIPPIVERKKGEMGMILQEIIQILPMILVVVVSLVGLRKALSMLSTLLHQS